MKLRDCFVFACADIGFADAEGEKSKCGSVVGFIHQPELVKMGRSDLSVITSCTVKRVVRSAWAAKGYAVSEGLRHLVALPSRRAFDTNRGQQQSHRHSTSLKFLFVTRNVNPCKESVG